MKYAVLFCVSLCLSLLSYAQNAPSGKAKTDTVLKYNNNAKLKVDTVVRYINKARLKLDTVFKYDNRANVKTDTFLRNYNNSKSKPDTIIWHNYNPNVKTDTAARYYNNGNKLTVSLLKDNLFVADKDQLVPVADIKGLDILMKKIPTPETLLIEFESTDAQPEKIRSVEVVLKQCRCYITKKSISHLQQ